MFRPRLHWGIAVAVVYTLFAGSTVGFVVFALSRPVELVSAAALGDGVRVEPDARGDALTIALPPSHAGATGRVTLYRPSDIHADRTAPLALDAAGQQRVPLTGLARGRWLLRLEWTAAGIAYAREQALNRP